MIYNKLIDKFLLKEKIDKLKNEEKKIVFTNGCFDLLHRGHVEYLKEAKNLGDFLLIAINSDDSVRRLKGYSRPIFSESDRAEILSSLKSVDFVCVFEEDTPLAIISYLIPNILVKGGDYNLDNIVGRDVVENNGGKVITIPFVENKSTTNIVNNIMNKL
jgi:rfaE bifunctional protein nucleotidyltransferase chain/domain